MAADCIFCKVIAREIPSKIIAESDDIIVIQDIAPKAPTHYLILPKKHIKDVQSLTNTDAQIAGDMMLMARDIAQHQGLKAFRLLINNGPEVGQSVFHLHYHMLAGKTMGGF